MLNLNIMLFISITLHHNQNRSFQNDYKLIWNIISILSVSSHHFTDPSVLICISLNSIPDFSMSVIDESFDNVIHHLISFAWISLHYKSYATKHQHQNTFIIAFLLQFFCFNTKTSCCIHWILALVFLLKQWKVSG